MSLQSDTNPYDDINDDIDESTIELLPEDYGDDAIGDVDSDLSTIVVVDNIPVIDMSRYEKLVSVINNKFKAFGDIVPGGLYLPTETNKQTNQQQTCGYAFIEYSNTSDAQRAITEGNNKALDSKHKLLVNSMLDFERYNSYTDEYQPPDKKSFITKRDYTSWLNDEYGRDQFVLRHNNDTEIYWFDPLRKQNDMSREYVYGGERERIVTPDLPWTRSYVTWSTNGSYLATYHPQGIALWAGKQFDKIGRFSHTNVALVDFSPCERYMITANVLDKSSTQHSINEEICIIWDIKSVKKLKSFSRAELLGENASATATTTKDSKDSGKGKDAKSTTTQSTQPTYNTTWPILKWSYDDKYVARVVDNGIAVYELPSMTLLDKKIIKVQSVADTSFSPTSNKLSYYVPELPNKPAHAAVIDIPSKQLVREKHLYNVDSIAMYWHDTGDYLCIKVQRRKTKSTLKSNLEIFRLREKDVPVDVIELDDKVYDFQWERTTMYIYDNTLQQIRFAIIHGQSDQKNNLYNISLYSIKKNVKKLVTFNQQTTNSLHWSPLGNFLLSAGLGAMNGVLTFIDADTLEIVSTNEHFMCNGIDWDPSGRYVMTSVNQPISDNSSNWRYTMENGYKVWSSYGALLVSVSVERLYQFLWRPRPKMFITKERIQLIKKELKDKYWRRFEVEDNEIQNAQLTGVQQERYQLIQEWKKYRAQRIQEYKDEKDSRKQLRNGIDSDNEDDYETVEQTVEEEIDVQYEIIQSVSV